METKTVYVVIKATVQVTTPEWTNVQTIIGSEADYNLTYADDDLKIKDTEMIACLDYNPVIG